MQTTQSGAGVEVEGEDGAALGCVGEECVAFRAESVVDAEVVEVEVVVEERRWNEVRAEQCAGRRVEGHDFGAAWESGTGARRDAGIDDPDAALGIEDWVLDIDEAGGDVLAGGAVLDCSRWPRFLAGEVSGDDDVVGGCAGVARVGDVDVEIVVDR